MRIIKELKLKYRYKHCPKCNSPQIHIWTVEPKKEFCQWCVIKEKIETIEKAYEQTKNSKLNFNKGKTI